MVTSIFSFSHNVFYPSQNEFQFFIKSHVYQNVRLLAISSRSSGRIGGDNSGLKNHAKNWIKNVVYTS